MTTETEPLGEVLHKALMNHLMRDTDELHSLIEAAEQVDAEDIDRKLEALTDVMKQATILLYQIEAGPVLPPQPVAPDPWMQQQTEQAITGGTVLYRVVERQVLTYTWLAKTTSLQAARDTALDGVPDGATEKLIESDVTAEVVTNSEMVGAHILIEPEPEHEEGDGCGIYDGSHYTQEIDKGQTLISEVEEGDQIRDHDGQEWLTVKEITQIGDDYHIEYED